VDLPESRDPDFIDNVFDNRAVLLAARLLLVSAAGVLAFGGLFIVVSIGNRMKNGEWLRRAGPFEISVGKLAEAEEEIGFWRQEPWQTSTRSLRCANCSRALTSWLRTCLIQNRKLLSVGRL